MNNLTSRINSLNKYLIDSLQADYPFGLAHGKWD